MLKTQIYKYRNNSIIFQFNNKIPIFSITDKKFSFLNADELEKMKEEEGKNVIKNEKQFHNIKNYNLVQ